LWKAYTNEDGQVFWETELGKGRPGWHIECSAMSTKYLGKTFDIHTGGVDLIFPHHENEIAQSEGCFEKKFVNYWIHNEWLLVEGKKMSKSAGNFYTLLDLLKKGYDPLAIRYLLLATHYRQQLNFTFEGLKAAKNALQRIHDFRESLNIAEGEDTKEFKEKIKNSKEEFKKAICDDIDIPKALSIMFEFIKETYKKREKKEIGKKDSDEAINLLEEFDSVLGLLRKKEKLPKEIEKLISEREKARKDKNFKLSDEIREEIKNKGFLIEDSPTGTRWKKI
jgi:cysteinyl-tRNA synthetase